MGGVWGDRSQVQGAHTTTTTTITTQDLNLHVEEIHAKLVDIMQERVHAVCRCGQGNSSRARQGVVGRQGVAGRQGRCG